MIDRALRLLADDAEDRAGAPVRQMVIAGLELDRAEIREYDRAVIRVGLDDAGRDPAVDVQPRQDPDQELAEPARHVVEKVHAVCRRVDLMYVLAVQNLMAKILVDGIDVGVVLRVDDGERPHRQTAS